MRRWSSPFVLGNSVRDRRLQRTVKRMPKIQILDTENRWTATNEDEYLWWPRVHWIDPGVVSGVATVWFDPHALFMEDAKTAKVVLAYSEEFLHGPETGRLGQVDRFLRMRELLDQENGLATGCESFVIRQMNQSEDFLSPVRIRAALDYQMSMIKPRRDEKLGTGVTLFTQSPSDAINAFSNDRLKALRMYRPGPDHVNDAKRHCLLFIRKLKGKDRGIDWFKDVFGNEEGWWT
jgi:hypothetical protein